jgi:hypothetical protein
MIDIRSVLKCMPLIVSQPASYVVTVTWSFRQSALHHDSRDRVSVLRHMSLD